MYWGKDHRHLELSDAIEGAELTWPDDETTLNWGVKQLLVWLKPHAEEFYRARSERAKELEKEEEGEDEDEDGRAGKKQKTSPEKGGLVIRTRGSGIERLADLQL